MGRGSYDFEVRDGKLANTPANLDRVLRMFRDGDLIEQRFGPGDPGDFDHGSWHILCHLAGGSGVFRSPAGLHWASITHDPGPDRYVATLTSRDAGGQAVTAPLGGDAAGATLADAELCGFVEGSSEGHILARGVQDPPGSFNGWLRQDLDQPPGSNAIGGPVWEHWCTTRDLRPTAPIGVSLVSAYLELVALLGGKFVAAVARGRRAHEHPWQLTALVKAGFLAREEAAWDTTPVPIPHGAEALLKEARPADALRAVDTLDWGGEPHYHMYARRIGSWSGTGSVRADLDRWLGGV